MKKSGFLILFYFLSFQFYFAQIKIQKHLTTDDGLLSNQIFKIIQDSKGYIWFTTFKGISIWDGEHFKNITKSDGLTSTALLDLVETSDSTIVLSAFGHGLLTYKNGVFDTINTDDGLGSNIVPRLRLLDGNALIFSTKTQILKKGKLVDFDGIPKNLTGVNGDYLKDSNGNIYASSRTSGFYVKEGKFEKVFTQKDGLVSSGIDLFEKDKYGNVLIASSQGLSKYKNGKAETVKLNGKPINWTVNEILVASDSTNYYGSEKGLIIDKNGKLELLTTENGLLENNIFALEEDENGTIYIGYINDGISIYNPDKFTNYISKDNSSKFIANSITQDENSRIILGTAEGLTFLTGNTISSKNNLGEINENSVFSIAENSDGKIFLGMEKGFGFLDKINFKYFHRTDKAKQEISDIEFSPFGDILMSVRRKGIEILTPKNQNNLSFVNQLINTFDTLKVNSLESHGIRKYETKEIKEEKLDIGKIHFVNLLNGLKSSWILDMLFLKDTTLVLGYHGSGISFYKNGNLKHLGKEDGLTDGIINILFEHSEGSLWIGTAQGGICVYQNGFTDTINVNDGLSSNDIRGIIQNGNEIYVSTENGLNIISKSGENYFIRQINKSDGLASNTCIRKSLFLDKDGYLWIGTREGLSKFNPKAEKIITHPPKVYITGLEIFNKEYSIDELLKNHKLNYDQNYIKFIYTGINLSAPEKTLYKFRLVGVDKDWVTSKNNNVQYTSLDNGNYKFEVMAKNEWDKWSEPVTLAFIIDPAWWTTWWFYSFIALAVASLIAFIASYRYRNLLAVEKIRTKISADLHDSIGSGLSEITILSGLLHQQQNAKTEDLQNGLKNISVTARSLVGNMSDIVWLVNPNKDSLKDLLLRLQDSYHEVFARANISFKINGIENLEEIHLPLTYRQHLFLLFKEAINNSLKYSECSKITLDILVKNRNLIISYKDDGKGFNVEERMEKGNGLTNMIERAKTINGNLVITSELNKGTVINFSGKLSSRDN